MVADGFYTVAERYTGEQARVMLNLVYLKEITTSKSSCFYDEESLKMGKPIDKNKVCEIFEEYLESENHFKLIYLFLTKLRNSLIATSGLSLINSLQHSLRYHCESV